MNENPRYNLHQQALTEKAVDDASLSNEDEEKLSRLGGRVTEEPSLGDELYKNGTIGDQLFDSVRRWWQGDRS